MRRSALPYCGASRVVWRVKPNHLFIFYYLQISKIRSKIQRRIIIAVHRACVSGCETSSIAVLCSVASRVQ